MNRLGYMIIHFSLHPLLLGLLGRQDVLVFSLYYYKP